MALCLFRPNQHKYRWLPFPDAVLLYDLVGKPSPKLPATVPSATSEYITTTVFHLFLTREEKSVITATSTRDTDTTFLSVAGKEYHAVKLQEMISITPHQSVEDEKGRDHCHGELKYSNLLPILKLHNTL